VRTITGICQTDGESEVQVTTDDAELFVDWDGSGAILWDCPLCVGRHRFRLDNAEAVGPFLIAGDIKLWVAYEIPDDARELTA
jgi:hypothetical protein